MLTLDALEKLILDGMTEDSGEMFSDVSHHVRNAARGVYAALTEQQDALQAVRQTLLEQGFGTPKSIPDVEQIKVYLERRVVLAVIKVTDEL